MHNRNAVLKNLSDFAVMTLASALFSVAFCWFYQPNGISVGGFTGISQIFNYIFPYLPIGIFTIVLNVPFFILAAKLQGFKLIVSSLYCMVSGSVFIDVFSQLHTFQPMEDKLLAAVCGGALIGIASGLQMKVGATNGGTELTARLLKYKFHHIPVGKLCLVIDYAIIVAYALTFRNTNNALYGFISMYVFSLMVDFVIYGGTHAKMAYIISSESERIKQALLDLNFGITMVDTHGGFSGDEKKMVICVVKRAQITKIKTVVNDIDSSAFVIVSEAHEVLGEGFGTYSPDEL